MTRIRAATGLGLAAAFLLPAAAWSQNGEERVPEVLPEDPAAAATPFGPGEHLVYKVKVGILNAGEGYMTVNGVDTVRGNPVYKATMGIKGGVSFAKVDDTYETWFDIRNLATWRFIRDIHEINYKSYRHYEMYPSERRWVREDNDEEGELASSLPLDDIAFIYFVRSLPLEVGKTFTLNRYFKEEGNPVVIEVLRRDERETEAGTFKTIVVRPIVQTKGLFGEGGEAELHFTDDDRRLLVYMKSDIPNFPGSLTLHLKEIQVYFELDRRARSGFDMKYVVSGSIHMRN